MKLQQDTNSWHAWRNKGLGSSDAPIIMGCSPYSNMLELGLYKRGLKKQDNSNFGTERGKKLEPEARAYFELRFDMEFSPAVFEHDQFDFLRCSLDGWNEKKKIILEIKCAGKSDHELAIEGTVPNKYYWQIQHQFMVSGGKKALYASYHPEHYPKGATIWMKPNLVDITRLLRREIWAWDLIKQDIDPSVSDPMRLANKCSDKKYYGSPEEAKLFLGVEHNTVFNCCYCPYYHLATKRMNKRSQDILSFLK